MLIMILISIGCLRYLGNMTLELALAEILLLQRELELARSIGAAQASQIQHMNFMLQKLTFELAVLRKLKFGQKSEATAALQGELFAAPSLELALDAKTTVNPPVSLKKTSASPRSAPRITLPSDLPVVETVLDLPDAQKIASDGTPLKYIGKDISDKLAVEPARFYILRTILLKYAHPRLEELGVQRADLPPQLIEGSLADISVYADVLVKKYDDHLPLHRIAEIYWRDGHVDLAKQTLCDWAMRTSERLAPLYRGIKLALLRDSVLHVDETGLPMLPPRLPKDQKHLQQRKTISARAWVYVGTTSKLLYYDFTVNKAGQHVRDMLQDWNPPDGKRYLQADAANNYDALYRQYDVQEVGCWAHARRKFFDIAKQNPQAQTAHLAVGKINALFEIERISTEQGDTPQQRHARRQSEAKPLIEALKPWLESQLRELLPKTPTAKAINYLLNHWPAFTRYLDDGRTRIDNNAAERALRVVAVGRKNWMFAGSPRGGEAAVIAYTLIESAKACGHNPRIYLADVLTQLAALPPAPSQAQIQHLLPQHWIAPSTSPAPSSA